MRQGAQFKDDTIATRTTGESPMALYARGARCIESRGQRATRPPNNMQAGAWMKEIGGVAVSRMGGSDSRDLHARREVRDSIFEQYTGGSRYFEFASPRATSIVDAAQLTSRAVMFPRFTCRQQWS